MFAPKRSNLALGLGVNQIELLQHVIYSKHVNWLKVWNFHLSQIIFSRIQQQNIPQVLILRSRSTCGQVYSLRGGDQKWEKNHRLPNPESLPRSRRLQAQMLLKNMKFEGIEIAQFQIPSSFQISSSISIRISYSLKASAEERATSSNYRFTQQIKNIDDSLTISGYIRSPRAIEADRRYTGKYINGINLTWQHSSIKNVKLKKTTLISNFVLFASVFNT